MCPAVPLAVLLLLAAPAAGQEVRTSYVAYARGLRVAEFDASYTLAPRDYRVRLAFRFTGVAGALFTGNNDAIAEGAWTGDAPAPRRFVSVGRLRGRDRRTVIDYVGAVPVVRDLVPSNEEDEREPVPAAAQAGTVDSLSAMAQLLRAVARTGRCDGRVATFDGRRLGETTARTAGTETLAPTGRSSFAGPALRCEFEGRQLGGFKRDDDPAVARRVQHGTAWIARLAPDGPPVPVRLSFETRWLGDVTMYLAPARQEASP